MKKPITDNAVDADLDQSSDHDLALAGLIAQLTDDFQRGQAIDLDRVCQEHPALADDLRTLWGTVVVTSAIGGMEAAKTSLPSVDDSGIWDLQLPIKIGSYELIEEIGRGGMGVVYRAQQKGLNRQVAIKMILRERLISEADKKRFLAEAEATARLQHPGIVPVYEVGDFNGVPYFTMQLVEGETLAKKLNSGPLPHREVARIVREIALALHFAHNKGLIHRDVKPSNILVSRDQSVKLTDFGLAKVLGEEQQLTRTGAILGTPNYMSPEQAAGRGNLGVGSDIYSLGAVLYHALTGRPPFLADSPVEMALKIIEYDPPAPRLIEPRIDRDLDMVVIRCLQKPSDLRYPSALELAGDLDRFLKDEPVSARSGRFGQVVARMFRETHHANILENWGLLWIWHSLVLLVACVLTTLIQWSETESRIAYALLWTIGLGTWAGVFWAMRQRMGPVTFVERQVAHVWGASMIAIGFLFPFEWWLDLKPLTLSPLLGVISGVVFLIKAGMFSGAFYFHAIALFACSIPMTVFPEEAHLIFGVVSALCFFVPGLKYHRQRRHVAAQNKATES